jgi:hypothetical protein
VSRIEGQDGRRRGDAPMKVRRTLWKDRDSAGITQLVEYQLSKLNVTSSSLVARSTRDGSTIGGAKDS